MQPLDGLTAHARELTGIFCDIDDTLTHAGTLVPAAYAALAEAHAAGLRVVPLTGRAAGFSAVFAATWPVDAVIAENGAVAFTRMVTDGKVRVERSWFEDEAARARAQPRLDAIRDDVLAHVPGAKLAEDQWLRLCDLAFDIGETQTLAPALVDDLCARIEAGGARAVVSTVHAHAMTGAWDKAKMAERLARERFGEEPARLRARWLFVGDSPNDQACFSYFPLSAGVANVRRYLDRLTPPPAFVATREGGYGFAEILRLVLDARRA